MTDLETRLAALEEKLDHLLHVMEASYHNSVSIYRRTAALAQMVEAIGEGKEPRLTKSMRAEIDATLNPEEFSELAKSDAEAFTHRYGKAVYDTWKKHGLKGVIPLGDLAPTKQEYKKKMQ